MTPNDAFSLAEKTFVDLSIEIGRKLLKWKSGVQITVTVSVTIALAVGLLFAWSFSKDGETGDQTAACPCTRIQDTTRKEVFVFSLNPKNKDWRFYNWNKVTTVVMVGFVDPDLVCLAHKYGARAVTIGNVETSVIPDPKARDAWIKKQLDIVQENCLDGINFDYENPILKNQTSLLQGYTALIAETRAAFRAKFPTSMITVDVAWSPDCIDSRCYDYLSISKVSDFLFVMAYDEQSQILGKCIAKANSPYNRTMSGIQRYLDIGVPADRLVLGIPWYGYYYPCLTLSKTDECSIREVPFRGVKCSDAAGKEIDYSRIIEMLKSSTGGRKFDNKAMSPYFNYKDPTTGIIHQIRYDDPQSLTYKIQMALNKNLRGVGVWNAESVNYSSTLPEQIKAVSDMWKTFPEYRIGN